MGSGRIVRDIGGSGGGGGGSEGFSMFFRLR